LDSKSVSENVEYLVKKFKFNYSPGDCSQYIFCLEGIGYPGECETDSQGTETFWNDETGNCVAAEESSCYQKENPTDPPTDPTEEETEPATNPTTQPTTASTPSGTTLPPSEGLPSCPKDKPNELVHFPGLKCDEYFVCLNGNLIKQTCPPNLNWNQNVQNCDLPERANCTVFFLT
jgi:hypothetical protein